MTTIWVLVVIACTGPGPTGDCTTKRASAFSTRWDCRSESIKRELMDETVRAYCQREKVAA